MKQDFGTTLDACCLRYYFSRGFARVESNQRCRPSFQNWNITSVDTFAETHHGGQAKQPPIGIIWFFLDRPIKFAMRQSVLTKPQRDTSSGRSLFKSQQGELPRQSASALVISPRTKYAIARPLRAPTLFELLARENPYKGTASSVLPIISRASAFRAVISGSPGLY